MMKTVNSMYSGKFVVSPHDLWFVSVYDIRFLSNMYVVALLFYVHGKHLRSCRDGQLT